MVKDKKIISGVATLGVGAFFCKLIGALYRVPLTNVIGGAGLGIYQMIFPVYAVLLDFSGAGVPSALAKIISSYSGEDKLLNAEKHLKSSLKFFFAIGLIGSAVMLTFSRLISTLQGNVDATIGYVALAPAVFLVSIISCYRGYFQGLMCMSPTAISQCVEQLVKLLFGLTLAYIFRYNLSLSVAGATLAISISEFFAFVYLYCKHKRYKSKFFSVKIVDDNQTLKRIRTTLKITLPITLIGIIIPFSQVIDSFLIINIIGKYRNDATALYGLLSGVSATVIGLPVAVCYGISTVAVPAVSGGATKKEKNDRAKKTLLLTLLVALPSAIFCAVFAPFIINLLFGKLNGAERAIAIKLLIISSPCVVLLSLVQTTNAVLIGNGKYYKPVISMGTGILIKILLNVVLLKMPNLNIYGGAVAVIACYFTITLINFIMIVFLDNDQRVSNKTFLFRKRLLQR